MSGKTIALITTLIILTVILVTLAVKTSQPGTPVAPVQQSTPTPAIEAKTKIFMLPNPVILSKNTATINVSLDSDDNKITGVQMEISYDPKILSFISITPSALFSKGVSFINTVDKKNGRISYAVGLSPEQAKTPHIGKIDVGTLVFAKLAGASTSATTEVKFLPKSLVSAESMDNSVLKESTGTIVQLQ